MKTSTDNLIREMHSGIAVLNSEMKTIRSCQKDMELVLNHVRELNIKQNGSIKINSKDIKDHKYSHKEEEKRFMWRFGVFMTVIMFLISIIVNLTT